MIIALMLTMIACASKTQTWTQIPSPSSTGGVVDVSFVGNICYAAFNNLGVIKSTDDGATWFNTAAWPNTNGTTGVTAVSFISPTVGWSTYNYAQYIYKTTDGGASWFGDKALEFGYGPTIIRMLSPSIGLAANKNYYYNNSTWVSGGSSFQINASGMCVVSTVQTPQNLNYTTMVVTVSGSGISRTTTNGTPFGTNGSNVFTVAGATFMDVNLQNDSVGYAVGNSGLVYKTVNCNCKSTVTPTWTQIPLFTNADLKSVCVKGDTVLVGGSYLDANYNRTAVAAMSTDAGQTWTVWDKNTTPMLVSKTIHKVCFNSKGLPFIFCDFGLIMRLDPGSATQVSEAKTVNSETKVTCSNGVMRTESARRTTVSLYDMSGRIVKTSQAETGVTETELDVPNGIYVAVATDGEGNATTSKICVARR